MIYLEKVSIEGNKETDKIKLTFRDNTVFDGTPLEIIVELPQKSFIEMFDVKNIIQKNEKFSYAQKD